MFSTYFIGKYLKYIAPFIIGIIIGGWVIDHSYQKKELELEKLSSLKLQQKTSEINTLVESNNLYKLKVNKLTMEVTNEIKKNKDLLDSNNVINDMFVQYSSNQIPMPYSAGTITETRKIPNNVSVSESSGVIPSVNYKPSEVVKYNVELYNSCEKLRSDYNNLISSIILINKD